jgi:FlaA1/EpsC-like NDP-sugar epimerase
LAIRRPLQSPLLLDIPVPALQRGAATGMSGLRPGVRAFVSGKVARVRGRHLFALDLVGMVGAAYLALSLSFDRLIGLQAASRVVPALAMLLVVRTTIDVRRGLYSRRWRFASVSDLTRIAVAVALGSSAGVVIFYGSTALGLGGWADGFPASFWPIEMLLSVAVLGVSRFAVRAASEWRSPEHANDAPSRRATLLYGAGYTGVVMARSAQRGSRSGIVPVGFLDDDPSLAGGYVAEYPVFGGLDALPRAVAETGAQILLVTMPSASGSAIRRVVDAAIALDLEVRTVPSVNELIDGSVDGQRMRPVRVEDLLRRPIVTGHLGAVEEIVRDQVVLITGAGGSIGSELARQVFGIGPRRLILVDRAESPLYLLQRELETRRGHGSGSGELHIQLANITNRLAMGRLIATEKPSVIFHAAAYKHVPMMESHPSDALFVNVGGTLALLDAAAAAGVERFVFVSTDKAVRPTSVMGASKRVAEMLVADTARRTGRPYVSVRFGNVLGSVGSVVPIFQDQLEKGEPLTITDKDMTRFFMTIPEAAWLILDASALGRNGDLFVLDMGEPVRIMDLAYDLVRLAGHDPQRQPIEITGLRPGEKLHEELFYDAEQVERTPNPKVLRVAAEPPSATVRDDVRRMLLLATGDDEDRLRDVLLAYAGGSPAASAMPETMPIPGVRRRTWPRSPLPGLTPAMPSSRSAASGRAAAAIQGRARDDSAVAARRSGAHPPP